MKIPKRREERSKEIRREKERERERERKLKRWIREEEEEEEEDPFPFLYFPSRGTLLAVFHSGRSILDAAFCLTQNDQKDHENPVERRGGKGERKTLLLEGVKERVTIIKYRGEWLDLVGNKVRQQWKLRIRSVKSDHRIQTRYRSSNAFATRLRYFQYVLLLFTE